MTTFHPFQRLPTELRVTIWKLAAIDASRTIILRCSTVFEIRTRSAAQWTILPCVVTQACVESRSVLRQRRDGSSKSTQPHETSNVTTACLPQRCLPLLAASPLASGIKTLVINNVCRIESNFFENVRDKFRALTTCTLRAHNAQWLLPVYEELIRGIRYGPIVRFLPWTPNVFTARNENKTVVVMWHRPFSIHDPIVDMWARRYA